MLLIGLKTVRITGGHTGGSSRKTGIIHWIAGCQTGGIAGSWHQNWTVTWIKNTIRKTGVIHRIAGCQTGVTVNGIKTVSIAG